MEIRFMTNEDKDKLVAFEKLIRDTESDIWVGDFDDDKYKEKLSQVDLETPLNKIIIAVEDDMIIGRADLIIMASMYGFDKMCYLDWIYTEINHRNKGVGKLLLEKAIKYTEEIGAYKLFLETAKNDEAQAFYKKQPYLKLRQIEVAEKQW